MNNNKDNSLSMSNNHDEIMNDNDGDEQQQQQPVKTKIIKCKTNNQQAQTSSYNILTPNGSSSTTILSVDVPNDHTSIKLHFRRVCSPSANDTISIHPTTNLLSQQSNESHPESTTKSISRTFFNSNELSNNKISRRFISTRRSSSIETDQYHSSSSIYDHLPKTLITNHTNIYDENTLKKPSTTKTNGNKRKLFNEQHDKKRTKLTSRTIKQSIINNTNNTSRSFFYFPPLVLIHTLVHSSRI